MATTQQRPTDRPVRTRISGVWTLTGLVAALVIVALVSLAFTGTGGAICLVIGIIVTLGLVPAVVAYEHMRGNDDVF